MNKLALFRIQFNYWGSNSVQRKVKIDKSFLAEEFQFGFIKSSFLQKSLVPITDFKCTDIIR
jgi:hypothetical protein